MTTQYAVWAGEFIDNDTADWYTDYNTAFDAWHSLADTLSEGDTASLLYCNDAGEATEPHTHEIRIEQGKQREYFGDTLLWA